MCFRKGATPPERSTPSRLNPRLAAHPKNARCMSDLNLNLLRVGEISSLKAQPQPQPETPGAATSQAFCGSFTAHVLPLKPFASQALATGSVEAWPKLCEHVRAVRCCKALQP